ncbi:hypothetical protein Tco_0355125 [Tanacetum coccineum]
MMARGAPNLAKRDLRNLQTTRASLVGSAFASTHFDRPKESGIKDLFGGEICTVMSPGGSIVASFENVESFFAVHTPPDHLIRTDFEQEGVIPEVVFDIFEKRFFPSVRDDIPFDNEIPLPRNG